MLTALDMSCCDEVTRIHPLASIPGLRRLSLQQCGVLADMTPLAVCTSLTALDLSFCCHVVDVTPLALCTRLASLILLSCGNADINIVAGFTALTRLRMGSECGSWCRSMTSIVSLGRCTSLMALDLSFCLHIADIGPCPVEEAVRAGPIPLPPARGPSPSLDAPCSHAAFDVLLHYAA